MLKDLLEIADNLSTIAPIDHKEIIDLLKKHAINDDINVSRILIDELSDYYAHYNKGEPVHLKAMELYDIVMDFFELNY